MLDLAKHNSQSSPYQIKTKKDQYLASFSPDDQYGTNIESHDKGNYAVAMMKELFLNIRYKSSYERVTEKAVHETFEFFMHSAGHMNSEDRMALCGIKSGLRPFHTLEIFSMLQIEIITGSGDIFADKIGYRKVRYLIF